ncbi:MAG: hypothetical protein V5B59_02505 [Candidatus Accumulibacter contiguus]|nr:hypothetical protein [Candidatus Accumulibacter contiguus]
MDDPDFMPGVGYRPRFAECREALARLAPRGERFREAALPQPNGA